ncbi:hypothetical protein [Amedibacillus sp. YH-ame10]
MEGLRICFIIILLLILVGILKGKRLCKHTFLCRHCHKEFHPRWTKIIFEIHAFDEFQLECPYCKTKDFCKDLGKKKHSC